MQYNIAIIKGDVCFVAHNLELGVVSQGDTIEQAIANIQEASELYLEDSNERVYQNHSPALLTNITISQTAAHG